MRSSVCLFASYVNGVGLPSYSKIYLLELKKHCTRLIYIHSNELDSVSILFLKENSIEILKVSNEGFDFGQWQKALVNINLPDYEQLCLVNDSCILFAPLDNVFKWFNTNSIDFGGLTESIIPQKHLQSYFLLFNKSTFKDLKYFFETTKASNDIHQIIKDFEIGLSQYLISENYSCGAFLSNDGYNGEFAPYYQCIESHINQGSPMIKKKIIFSSYRKEELFTLARMNFNTNVDFYIQLIKRKNKHLLISFEEVLNSEKKKLNTISKLKYDLTCILIQLYRKFKRDKK
jgi:lipopolysaccharide biosynthesis protein